MSKSCNLDEMKREIKFRVWGPTYDIAAIIDWDKAHPYDSDKHQDWSDRRLAFMASVRSHRYYYPALFGGHGASIGWSCDQYGEFDPNDGPQFEGGVLDKEPDVILEQFTGLLDKNGKEIYEGDILFDAYTKTYHVVEWISEKDGYDWTGFRWSGHEVVGDIHQNPELLK